MLRPKPGPDPAPPVLNPPPPAYRLLGLEFGPFGPLALAPTARLATAALFSAACFLAARRPARRPFPAVPERSAPSDSSRPESTPASVAIIPAATIPDAMASRAVTAPFVPGAARRNPAGRDTRPSPGPPGVDRPLPACPPAGMNPPNEPVEPGDPPSFSPSS